MNFKQPLYWHQGLFLQPQHFQYASLHSKHVDIQYMKQSSSFPWGVVSIQLDELALNSGAVDIRAAELLFEDGTLLDFPANVHLRPRNFEAQWQDRAKPLQIYVGLTRLNDDGGNVTLVPSYNNAPEINTRYVSLNSGENFQDLHEGNNETNLKTLKYALTIYFEHELDALQDQLLLPVAAIEMQGEEIKVSNEFVAPSLSIKASAVLMANVKAIRDELIGRSRQLETYKSTSTARVAEFNPIADRYRSALQVVARYSPLLNHYIENPVVHPVDVYGTLRQLVGELSTFSNKFTLLGESLNGSTSVKRYQHTSLSACFSSVSKAIIELLDELTVSPELLVRFEKQAQGSYSCNLSNEFFTRQNSMYLRLETNMPASELVSSFNLFSKLGAESQVGIYAQRAIPGVPVNFLPEQPVGLERRAKVIYFNIDRDSDKWKSVEEQGVLSLLWDEAPEDLVVEMVVVQG